MTDIRTRLTDELLDILTVCDQGAINEILDVLLSLPGIAIVELPEGIPSNDPEILREWLSGEVMSFRDGSMEFDWHSIKVENARIIAAALLAAANAADPQEAG